MGGQPGYKDGKCTLSPLKYKTVRFLLRAARKSLGLSARQLADKLHVSKSTVYGWEHGTKEISISHGITLRTALMFDTSMEIEAFNLHGIDSHEAINLKFHYENISGENWLVSDEIHFYKILICLDDGRLQFQHI